MIKPLLSSFPSGNTAISSARQKWNEVLISFVPLYPARTLSATKECLAMKNFILPEFHCFSKISRISTVARKKFGAAGLVNNAKKGKIMKNTSTLQKFSFCFLIFSVICLHNVYAQNVGIGTSSPAARLDVAGRTLKLSNTYPRYRWWFGGAQDLDWKKIADVTIASGSYRAVTFEVVVTDAYTNFGHSADARKMTFYVSMRRSGAGTDDLNDAIVKGPSTDYVRAVKTATGVYELQVRQATDWRHMTVEAQVISEQGATVTYIDNPANGSTSGTNYTSTGNAFYEGYWTRSGTSLYNTYQGDNVGIGTTAPWGKLSIEQSSGNSGVGIHRPGVSAGGLAAGLGGGNMALFGNRWTSTTGESIRFGWAPWNGDWNDFTEVMRIHTNGNVGIGTSSPNSKLVVSSSGSSLSGSVVSSAFSTNAGALGTSANDRLKLASIGFTSTNNTSIGIEARRQANGSDWTTTAIGLKFEVDNTTWDDRAIWLTSAGNVGIGTSSPGYKLQVAGNVLFTDASGNQHTWFPYTDGNNYISANATHIRSASYGTYAIFNQSLGGSGDVFVMANNSGVLYKSSTSPYANMPQGTMVGLCIRNTSSGCCNCNAGVKAPITGWNTGCPSGYSWQQIAARWEGLNERWVYTCIKD